MRKKGLSSVFSCEIDKYANITYKENFNEEPFGDITKLDYKKIPNHDILLAGFPCPAFLIVGLRKRFNDERGQLFYCILNILKLKKPNFFILKNVKGLLNHDKGETFNKIRELLKKENYFITSKILNTADLGIPQNRERVLIIEFKNKVIYKKFSFSLKKTKELRLSDFGF